MNDDKAIIFDLDGTLLNTIEDIAFAMNSVLSRHNLPTHNTDDYRYFVGGGLLNLVIRTIPEIMKQQNFIDTCLNEVVEEYSKCIDQHTKPYPGIEELLDKLTAKNIPFAILSNKDHQFVTKITARYFAKFSFKAIFGARTNIPIKPHPQSALEVASIININPNQIAYVGDSDVDMKTATNAGMLPIGVTWGFRTEEELVDNGAKMIIHSPHELLNIF